MSIYRLAVARDRQAERPHVPAKYRRRNHATFR